MHHDASRDAPPTLIVKPHAKDKNGGAAKALFCRNLMEACEAREHGSDSAKQSSGGINQARKRVDERIWAVQPRGARGHKATKEHGVHWRKLKPRGAARTPGRPASPLFKAPGARLP
jgi:hypothetical protein